MGARVHKWPRVAFQGVISQLRVEIVGNVVRPSGGGAKVDAAAAPATVCGECPPVTTGPMRAGKGVTHIDP